jgi:ribonuclease Z
MCGIVVAAQLTANAPEAQEPAASIKVTFLGTGSPTVSMDRFSPCILVEAGRQRILFDAGRGCVLRLQQARVNLTTVTGIFLTHLHSDHVLSVPDLFLTGWIQGRTSAFRIWGPVGTKDMVSHLLAAYAFDIEARVTNGRARPVVDTAEVRDGVAFDQDGVTVRAFEVDHGEISPAFGYRIDAGGRSLVLSGDTRPSNTLIQMAQGVDVLVHEVALGNANPTAQQKFVLTNHTSPAQAAEVFGRVKPRLAIYSHVIVHSGATEQQLMSITRERYAGRVELASDLTVVNIDSEITIDRPR